MPVQNWLQLLDRWHYDALEFLRSDVPRIVVIILIAAVLIRLLRLVTGRLIAFSRTQELPSRMRAQQLHTLASVLRGVGIAIVVFLAAMQILPLLGINMGPLLASAGVAGLAIGFGAQTLVRDVINGFFILMENQYDVGDTVRTSGVAGTVEHMTLRRTVLRDLDGTLHTIPNSEIKLVSNMARDWTLTTLHILVSHKEDSDRVIALLKEVGREVRELPAFSEVLVADPVVPGIERISSGEVDYLMLAKTKPGKQYEVARELRLRIKARFEKNGVQLAGPAPVYVFNQSPVSPSKE